MRVLLGAAYHFKETYSFLAILKFKTVFLGHDENIKKFCDWTTSNGRVYHSVFKKEKASVMCKSEFSKVLKNDTADIRVVGFNLSKTHFVDTTVKLHVGGRE